MCSVTDKDTIKAQKGKQQSQLDCLKERHLSSDYEA